MSLIERINKLTGEKGMAVNIFRDKFQSKSFQESIWNLMATILFIYVGGFGILLTTYLNTMIWEWNIIIITTIVSVIPVVKSWISRNANIQLDELRAENMADADAWQKEKANLVSDWQAKYDKLKDEASAKDIKIHMLEYDLTHPSNIIKTEDKKIE